jgi:uncharacterized membrane protein
MNIKKRTRTLVVVGLLTALEAILAFTPAGFINILPVSATTMHIPVIIAAVLEGPLVGGILGLVFGCLSLLSAFTTPTLFSPIFQNPLVSVLPRILVGVGAGYLFKVFVKLDALEKTSKVKKLVSGAVYILSALALAGGAYYYVGLFAVKVNGMTDTLKLVSSLVPAVIIIVLAALLFRKFLAGDKRDIGAAVTGVGGALINAAGVLGMMILLEAQKMYTAVPAAASALGTFFAGIILTNTIPEAILACAVTILVFKAMKPVYDRRQAKPLNKQG